MLRKPHSSILQLCADSAWSTENLDRRIRDFLAGHPVETDGILRPGDHEPLFRYALLVTLYGLKDLHQSNYESKFNRVLLFVGGDLFFL